MAMGKYGMVVTDAAKIPWGTATVMFCLPCTEEWLYLLL
jgi:hypothetical protein